MAEGDKAPLLALGTALLGPAGALLILLAAVTSLAGNLHANMTASPRVTHALAARGDLPAWIGAVHPRFATPHGSILLMAVLVAALALSGGFVWLAVVSTLARMAVYAVTIAAWLKIERGAGPAISCSARSASCCAPRSRPRRPPPPGRRLPRLLLAGLVLYLLAPARPLAARPAHRAAAPGWRGSGRAHRHMVIHSTRSSSGNMRIRPERGGHSSSKLLLTRVGGIEFAFEREHLDQLAAVLPNGAQRHRRSVRHRPHFLGEFAHRRFQRLFAGFQRALGHHPRARILARPIRAAGMAEQDLQAGPCRGDKGECPRCAAAACQAAVASAAKAERVSSIHPPPSSRSPS